MQIPTTPQIQLRDIESLIPYARNSRTHSDAQTSQIAASIREFGFTNPVLVDPEGGIIAGHGRVLAARKLGLTEIPCIELSHLSDIQRRAYVIADNKLALNSGWDAEMLKLEIEDLQASDLNMELLGFDSMELSSILTDEPPVQGGGTDPYAEWDGMPEFDQQDKTAFRSIIVHFKSQQDVDDFAKLVSQNITDKTKFLWFPNIEIETYADKEYEQVETGAGYAGE